MIDRRQMLAAAGTAWTLAGGTWARPRARPASAHDLPSHDLTGVWTNAWYTKLERPKAFKALVATPAEAVAYEAPRRALHGEIASVKDVLGQNESEFPDNGPGLARIRGEIRSSWIVDPPDGKVPWTAEARARLYIGTHPPDDFDNVEARDTEERCLTAPGAAAPILNSHDANLIQIVQTPGWLAIVGEKNHDTRIVRLEGAGPAPAPGPDPRGAGVRNWAGSSVGRWEGATLVVETTGLRPGLTKIQDALTLSDHARVVERFTRTGPAEIAYLFEVEDPSLFTRPWRGEMIFRPAEGQIYEYACHEGNYSLPSILAAARQGNQPGPTAPEPAPAKPAKGGK
jgi:hypothetical protein